ERGKIELASVVFEVDDRGFELLLARSTVALEFFAEALCGLGDRLRCCDRRAYELDGAEHQRRELRDGGVENQSVVRRAIIGQVARGHEGERLHGHAGEDGRSEHRRRNRALHRGDTATDLRYQIEVWHFNAEYISRPAEGAHRAHGGRRGLL